MDGVKINYDVSADTISAVNSKNLDNTSSAVPDNSFRVCSKNLPQKVSFFTKIKNVLFYEIKVELTPKQQKIEDDINAFLHQEITWGKVHDFLFQEITFKKQ